jgi:hypothetical protein
MKLVTSTTLAAILLVSGTSLGMAQVAVDANGGASVNAGAGVGTDTSAGAGTSVNAGTSVDAGTNSKANASGNTDTSAGASGSTDTSANASGAVSSQTYGSVISALNASGGSSSDLATITDNTTINIILLSSLKGEANANASALDKVLADKSADLTSLRGKIDANAALKAKLQSSGHSSADVVAITTKADGSLDVYVDDRA